MARIALYCLVQEMYYELEEQYMKLEEEHQQLIQEHESLLAPGNNRGVPLQPRPSYFDIMGTTVNLGQAAALKADPLARLARGEVEVTDLQAVVSTMCSESFTT